MTDPANEVASPKATPWTPGSVKLIRGRPGPVHDSLHMQEGLKHCHCMCTKCWRSGEGLTTEGKRTGTCICPNCPCHTGSVY